MRIRRAFSLVEIVVVLGLIAVLSTIAVTTLANVQGESRDRAARAALETVAGGQETYHLDRGAWAVSADATASFSTGGLTVTTGASTGPDVVAVGEVLVDGLDALGMAVLDGNGNCLTLVVPPPTVGGEYEIQRRPGATCTGATAGQP